MFELGALAFSASHVVASPPPFGTIASRCRWRTVAPAVIAAERGRNVSVNIPPR